MRRFLGGFSGREGEETGRNGKIGKKRKDWQETERLARNGKIGKKRKETGRMVRNGKKRERVRAVGCRGLAKTG
jgi:hypothetical protein